MKRREISSELMRSALEHAPKPRLLPGLQVRRVAAHERRDWRENQWPKVKTFSSLEELGRRDVRVRARRSLKRYLSPSQKHREKWIRSAQQKRECFRNAFGYCGYSFSLPREEALDPSELPWCDFEWVEAMSCEFAEGPYWDDYQGQTNWNIAQLEREFWEAEEARFADGEAMHGERVDQCVHTGWDGGF